MTTRTILTVLDTYVLRCFLRELEAARACCSGVGAASEFFFLICHSWPSSHNESNKRHKSQRAPAARLVHWGQINLHHFGAKGDSSAAGS